MALIYEEEFKNNVNDYIVDLVKSRRDVSYIDAVVEACEKFDIEVDNQGLKQILSPVIREKLKNEYIKLNLFPDEKTNNLSSFIK